MPAADITPLFDTPGYREFGAIFWPDFWKDQPENVRPIYWNASSFLH